ncbi:MAG: 50S ribosomal protein L4 [Candidatus Methylomirabilales bacterium]
MPRVLDVLNVAKEKVDQVALPDEVFGVKVHGPILHQMVRWQRNRRRQGTASTKGRSEVRGGGKKPWRQKHTGRARVGSIRSPIWRHGGIVFGPKPRHYGFHLPHAMRRVGLRSALTAKVSRGEMLLLEDLLLDRPSTKGLQAILESLGVKGKILIVVHALDTVLVKSARNLPRVTVLPASGVNVYDLLQADAVIMTREACGRVTEALQAC